MPISENVCLKVDFAESLLSFCCVWRSDRCRASTALMRLPRDARMLCTLEAESRVDRLVTGLPSIHRATRHLSPVVQNSIAKRHAGEQKDPFRRLSCRLGPAVLRTTCLHATAEVGPFAESFLIEACLVICSSSAHADPADTALRLVYDATGCVKSRQALLLETWLLFRKSTPR